MGGKIEHNRKQKHTHVQINIKALETENYHSSGMTEPLQESPWRHEDKSQAPDGFVLCPEKERFRNANSYLSSWLFQSSSRFNSKIIQEIILKSELTNQLEEIAEKFGVPIWGFCLFVFHEWK